MRPYRRNLTLTQRLEYIGAIKCMMSKPAKTGDIYAGAKSRFDDFQALHISQADYIHWCVSRWGQSLGSRGKTKAKAYLHRDNSCRGIATSCLSGRVRLPKNVDIPVAFREHILRMHPQSSWCHAKEATGTGIGHLMPPRSPCPSLLCSILFTDSEVREQQRT